MSLNLNNVQTPLSSKLCAITEAVEALANSEDELRGAIFTRREVVDFILDLVGYTSDQPLYEMRLLEPSFGNGDFLFPVIDRLLKAWIKADAPIQALKNTISGVELHRDSYLRIRKAVIKKLVAHGIGLKDATQLSDNWLIQGDYLLTALDIGYHVVVGNPPYVRQERIPDVLMAEYRRRYTTIYDRADIYVPFIERSLKLLKPEGQLGFICADRWMKNRYGGPLREFVAKDYHLKTYVDMVGTNAFYSDVSAYPAITIISREHGKTTRIAHPPEIKSEALTNLAKQLTGKITPASDIREIENITAGSEPWLLGANDQLALVRRLESVFPSIEDVGCKVGIGVATGADSTFIGHYQALDVEPSRKLPLAMTRDIKSGNVEWYGLGIVNPFGDDGKLVDLKKFPRLQRYMNARKDLLMRRHVAQKSPSSWYRTIDRIYPEIARQPKLLIPDIKGEAHIVYEDGQLYPHHNLYYITSNKWHIKALQAVLLSGIARLFVATYSTKMRGGFLRFQAQYLRRIRLPMWDDITPDLQTRLIEAGEERNVVACNKAVGELYKLSFEEQTLLEGK